ncbi:hypothetical protein MN0502_20000 [Arthrobacter sp. MN05-02]|nr:hypothetical protein MN0502_20000 [Arthrobacter sp. MN05-02]
MSRSGDAAVHAPLASSLTAALDRLGTAYELGVGRLPPERLERLHATLDRAGARRSLSGNHTVVGVFGPTGSGKSSLVNALSGTDAARVAVRRPTTSEPLALVWEPAGSGELLDWLGVGQRVELPAGAPLLRGIDLPGHDGGTLDAGASAPSALPREEAHGARGIGDTRQGRAEEPRGLLRRIFGRRGRRGRGAAPSERDVSSGSAQPEATGDAVGLILLDLPDFDSTAAAHRDVVERLARQVDVLLWVVDPQKYADAALHHGFLRGLASHEAVTLVALNQADRLEPADLDAVTSSLAGILAGEGLPGVAVLAVSARTGTGLDRLAEAIRAHAESRAAATRRLTADAAGAATELLPFAAAEPVPPPAADARSALSDELGVAAGVPLVVDAVRSAYRRDAHAVAGWPVTRWLAKLRPDPLRRLNLRRQDVVPEVRRSSLPPSGSLRSVHGWTTHCACSAMHLRRAPPSPGVLRSGTRPAERRGSSRMPSTPPSPARTSRRVDAGGGRSSVSCSGSPSRRSSPDWCGSASLPSSGSCSCRPSMCPASRDSRFPRS